MLKSYLPSLQGIASRQVLSFLSIRAIRTNSGTLEMRISSGCAVVAGMAKTPLMFKAIALIHNFHPQPEILTDSQSKTGSGREH